jgi:hypothetical protein
MAIQTVNKLCTSIGQSNNLRSLGLDIHTADTYWWFSGDKFYMGTMDDGDFDEKADQPSWSLAALEKLIPPTITDDEGETYKISITKNEQSKKWTACYVNKEHDQVCCIFCEESPDLIDVFYNTVCMLLLAKKI